MLPIESREDPLMARAKQPAKRKRSKIALPAWGAAGMSLAMAGGASAAVAPADVPPQSPTLTPITTLSESEVSDVSLATFYVFDKELGGTSQLGSGLQLAGGCRGGGGGGCRGGAGGGCRGGGGGCRAGGGCRGGGCGAGGCGGRGCGGRGCGCRCSGGCGCACVTVGCSCACCIQWGACTVCL
jgi:hypothetical protein